MLEKRLHLKAKKKENKTTKYLCFVNCLLDYSSQP
ncbi:MAG: hypothetical protein RLY64_1129, partial [Bacteroidota bacterium]